MSVCVVFQRGGAQPRGAVERAVLVHVQDVRQRQHGRARARAHAGLRQEGVQGSVPIFTIHVKQHHHRSVSRLD